MSLVSLFPPLWILVARSQSGEIASRDSQTHVFDSIEMRSHASQPRRLSPSARESKPEAVAKTDELVFVVAESAMGERFVKSGL